MELEIPGPAMRALLASERQLRNRWPAHGMDAMMLLMALDLSEPSLAEAVNTGLVAIATPVPNQPEASLTVVHRRAALVAIALDSAGKRLAKPHARIAKVIKLQAVDLVVDGVSALRRTG